MVVMSDTTTEGSMQRTRADPAEWTKVSRQLFASVFFGIASISIITVNKAVLTTFRYITYIHPYNAHQSMHYF